jgi:hypothetical protein
MHGAFASVITEAWGSLGERRFLFLTLLGFVCAFGFIRLSTRLMRSPRVPWWPGSIVSDGGVHVHHLFFGIVLMMAAGGLSFAAGETDGPWYAIYAVLFGVGFGLAIDEYALWLHLDDVYWSEQGRQSIDAVIVFAIISGFMLLGAYPITIGTTGGFEDIIGVLIGQMIGWVFVVICFMKGKLMWGVLGIYLWPVALYGATRLAKPESRWAKKRYDEAKLAKSRKRYKHLAKPHVPDEIKVATSTPAG